MDESRPQQRASHRPATSYQPGPFLFPTTGNPHAHPFRNENGHLGSMLVCRYSPPAPSCHYSPPAELRNQWDGLGRREGLLHRADLGPHRVAGRNQGLPDRQRFLESPEPIFLSHSNFNGSANPHAVFHSHASTSGGGDHESQLQAINGIATSVPRPLHPNDLGPGSYSTTNNIPPTPEGLPWEAERDCHNPYAKARSYRRRQRLGKTSTSPELSGGTTDTHECAEPPYRHSLGDEGIGNEGRLAAVLPNLHSNGMFDQHTGDQPSRKGRKTEQAEGQDKVRSGQKRTLRRKPAESPDSTKQFPATPVVTHGITHFIRVPQTWYKTTARQDDWEKGPPIEFWGIRLTDAVNKTWIDVHNYNDEAFSHEGVGGSILCRLNFSGREIGKWKIMTTNHKNPPEAITRKKLAFEVAKFVRRHIKDIKDEPGCADITFENLALMRLFRVSKASWQPELWYEDPAPV